MFFSIFFFSYSSYASSMKFVKLPNLAIVCYGLSSFEDPFSRNEGNARYSLCKEVLAILVYRNDEFFDFFS